MKAGLVIVGGLTALGIYGVSRAAVKAKKSPGSSGAPGGVAPGSGSTADLVCDAGSLSEVATRIGAPTSVSEANMILSVLGVTNHENAFCGAVRQEASVQNVFNVVNNAAIERETLIQQRDPTFFERLTDREPEPTVGNPLPDGFLAWWNRFIVAYGNAVHGETVKL